MDARTDEIINRFKDSWTETELRYDDLIKSHKGFEKLRPLRQFISRLKEEGECKYFRLGTSMHTLVISRSVDHGLRIDQKCIKIESVNTDEFEVILRDGAKIYREFKVNNFDDVRLTKLLRTLKETLVD